MGVGITSLAITCAERLLGRGHLAARLSGEGEIMRAQVPYTSDKEGEMRGGLSSGMWDERR